MKLKMEVDCTPEEARRFLGFPDVKAVNDEIVAKMSEAVAEGQAAFSNPDAFMKFWMPFGARGVEEFQNLMQTMMTKPQGSSGDD